MTDWARLATATGKATWVPERLDALRSDDAEARDKALRKLGRDLFKGPKWQSAAPAVVSSLIDLALDAKVPERHRVLSQIARLVARNPAPYVVDGFDLADPETKKTYARGTGKQAHAALAKRASELLELVRDPDARVRAAACYVALFVGATRRRPSMR